MALPTDMVKVLKSQDENYIRMKRHQGLKVRLLLFPTLRLLIERQKIDALKARLSMLADLTAGLDEEEIETLKAAGLIPGGGKKGRTKGKNVPKKIIFATEEKGKSLLLYNFRSLTFIRGTRRR